MPLSSLKLASISGLILFGTTTSLFAKIVYELQAVGSDGQQKFFHKPWAMTSLMFMGMSFCLPLALWNDHQKAKRKAQSDAEMPLLDGQEPEKPRSQLREALMLAIPTVFDLMATILMNVGLLWVSASVYQMMRGAEMLFAALFSVLFLGRKLNQYHLSGIGCCLLGVMCVGTASFYGGAGSAVQVITPTQNLCGMALIVISQAVQAAQLTFEDFFMADLNIPAMKIVGFEGVFGVIGTVAIMGPVAYLLPGTEGEGIHEDGLDTLAMIKNSQALQVILAVDMAALLMYNVAGMVVTGELGAVFRTVLETMRTLFVWLLSLLLFYTPLGMGKLGEPWNNYSYLQAFGFAVLVTGTLVYGRGDEETRQQEMAEAAAIAAAQEPQALPAESGEQYRAVAGGAVVGTMPTTSGYTPIPIARSSAGYASMPADIGPASPRFRATQTIVSGSFVGSLGKSHMQSHMARRGHELDE